MGRKKVDDLTIWKSILLPNKVYSRQDLTILQKDNDLPFPKTILSDFRVGRNMYSLSNEVPTEVPSEVPTEVTTEVPIANTESLDIHRGDTNITNVPVNDPLYTPFGDFSLLKQIVASRKFYPVFVSGLSGNGKTLSVEQACASAQRELIRVNITIETDEDDLLGGFRLENGSTKWCDGPVIRAMKAGAVLLLDEVDLGSHKILCLQPVLEGKGIFLKKINSFVLPTPGFNVIATANTKGQGSESGKFIGTNILNEAFLERFVLTINQPYPTETIERNILQKVFTSLGFTDDHTTDFINKLVQWAHGIRKTYEAGGMDDLISTRRLVHISQTYGVLNLHHESDKAKIKQARLRSIELCTARFDDFVQTSFVQLYESIDEYGNEEVSEEVRKDDNPDDDNAAIEIDGKSTMTLGEILEKCEKATSNV